MFQDNNWYGNRYILSKYLNEKDKLFFGSIQHGYTFLHDDLKIKKRKLTFAPWFVWNSYYYSKLKKDGHSNIIPIGSPFVYLHKILKYKKKNSLGTLIIPSKSAYEIDMVVDYVKLYEFVKKNFNAPYAILVGYGDLKRAKSIRSKLKDCKFITCGKRSNKFFTYNLYNYINKYKNIVHFYPGSPLFYSLFLKKKTYYYKKRFVKSLKGKGIKLKGQIQLKILEKEDKEIIESIKKECGINFNNLNTLNNYKKAKLALGYGNIKSKNKLKKLLGWNSLIKYCFALIFKIIINLKNYEVTNHKY